MKPQEGKLAGPLHLPWPTTRKIGLVLGLVAVALIPIVARAFLLQNPNPNGPRNVPDFINRLPDVNDQARMRREKANNFDALNTERKLQIADDSARLIKLTAELKAEMDKTGEENLSVSSIRKINEIEKLAHTIKEKMMLTATPNSPTP